MRNYASFCQILFTLIVFNVNADHASEFFDHHKFLDQQGEYELYWKSDNEWITIESHVATTGWVGLGFSPHGGMRGADIVVGGLKDGRGYLYDMHATQNGRPTPDTNVDYILLEARENRTHTIIKFRRKLATCDNDDWRLTNDTVRIIFAYNAQDATSQDSFPMHTFGHYGSRSLMLFEQPKSQRDAMPRDVTTLDLTVDNVVIPEDYHTLYWCTIIKLPKRRKHHIIKYEPLMQRGNERFLHHMVVYHCPYDMEEFVGKAEACFNRDHTQFSEMYKCTTRYMAGWAVGADAVVWGDNLGEPIFEDGASPYYMLEVHYDNSHFIKGIARDNSGMRFYITPTLRPSEIENLALGMGVQASEMIVPPHQDKITLSTMCTPDCTKMFPRSGIKIVGGFLHEHLIGSGLKLRHIRNGQELPPIFEDKFYDFNYQEHRNLNPPRTVLPNDTLIVECDFNSTSSGRTTVTYVRLL